MARDLQEGANHLAYEWLTTAEMAGRLWVMVHADDADALGRNAFLEAGLLHYRCLVNFLCGGLAGRWHPDDMKPEDFLGRPWWPDDSDEFDRHLRGRLPAINQCLQHVSWGRTDHYVIWPFGLLAHEAHFAMGLFLQEVDAAAPWRRVLESAQERATAALPPREKWPASVVELAPPRTPRTVADVGSAPTRDPA